MVTINPSLGISKKPGYQKRKANAYNRLHQRTFIFNVNKIHEKKILKWMEENKPYQTALKRLILEEIDREKKAKKANKVAK